MTVHTDLAWAYDFPTRQLLPIAGMIAFYNEKVDIFSTASCSSARRRTSSERTQVPGREALRQSARRGVGCRSVRGS